MAVKKNFSVKESSKKVSPPLDKSSKDRKIVTDRQPISSIAGKG